MHWTQDVHSSFLIWRCFYPTKVWSLQCNAWTFHNWLGAWLTDWRAGNLIDVRQWAFTLTIMLSTSGFVISEKELPKFGFLAKYLDFVLGRLRMVFSNPNFSPFWSWICHEVRTLQTIPILAFFAVTFFFVKNAFYTYSQYIFYVYCVLSSLVSLALPRTKWCYFSDPSHVI